MLPLVITVEQNDGGVRRYGFADSPVSIGRSPFAELQLSEPFVSRWEGTLRFDEHEMTYFNLGGTNSTFLDGKPIGAREEDISLSVDSVLMIGELTLRFAREPVSEGDLRRKGKRRPTRDAKDVGIKTVYLDAADAWKRAPVPGASIAVPSAASTKPAALAAEPELQPEPQSAGLSAASEIPELREWLRAIHSDLLPDSVHFDSRLTLTRVLGLVEALIQSLAEIHDAQETVRRRWLGRGSRRSVLQSEQGNLVLAYLLNPQADWNERLGELEQSVREVVTHELALFRATLDGARTLVHAISPEVITEAEHAEPTSDAAPRPRSFWDRCFGKHAEAAQLWQRFLTVHAQLIDGARYERVFLGRVFARSYLAAMGKPEAPQG